MYLSVAWIHNTVRSILKVEVSSPYKMQCSLQLMSIGYAYYIYCFKVISQCNVFKSGRSM